MITPNIYLQAAARQWLNDWCGVGRPHRIADIIKATSIAQNALYTFKRGGTKRLTYENLTELDAYIKGLGFEMGNKGYERRGEA